MNLEYFAHKIAKSIQEERFQEAQTERLLKEIKAGRPSYLARLRRRAGETLISIGRWMTSGMELDTTASLNPCPEGQSCG